MGILGGIGNFVAGAASSAGDFLFGNNDARDDAMAERHTQLQGADTLRGYAEGQMMGAQGRQAPRANAAQLGQAAQIAQGPQGQARSQMQTLAGQLAGVSNGTQRGAGELAVGRQAQQAAATQFANARMARGANSGIMARAAARQLGDLGTNAAGMASQSALQDQSNARGQLAGVLGGMRGQDIDLANAQAQLNQQRMLQQGQFDQQTGLANQAAQLQQSGLNDAYSSGMFQNYLNTSDAELRARMQRMAAFGAQPKDGGVVGGALQAGGQALAAYAGSGGGG